MSAPSLKALELVPAILLDYQNESRDSNSSAFRAFLRYHFRDGDLLEAGLPDPTHKYEFSNSASSWAMPQIRKDEFAYKCYKQPPLVVVIDLRFEGELGILYADGTEKKKKISTGYPF